MGRSDGAISNRPVSTITGLYLAEKQLSGKEIFYAGIFKG
jgi:hypothetical protein